MATNGWDAVSTNRIARTAGVSIGFLYKYFPSREAVARAVVHKLWDDELAHILAAGTAPDVSLATLAASYFDFVARDPSLHAIASSDVVSLVAADARPWDAKVLDLLTRTFDTTYEDSPRKTQALENIYAMTTHLARRTALLHPDQLQSGSAKQEFLRLLDGYLASFTPKRSEAAKP
jgi:AcrR family transcriptional regulator